VKSAILDEFPLYEIFEDGTVISHKRFIPKKLKHSTNAFGYKQLLIRNKDNKSKSVRVHHLVARAFIPNPNNYKEIHHKDSNKTNNHVSNLEWCNRSKNVKESWKVNCASMMNGLYKNMFS
jgi:hypothetical protein